IARLMGREGFSRVVAAKRMPRHYLADPEFKRMFLEEALLAARVRHPNVVPIVDVLSHESELIIVMEYVHGESLLALMRLAHSSGGFPVPIAASIAVGALQGLHAAHEAKDERGEPLGIVHRDVSPHNVLVSTDGVARVVDFGVAKAVRAKEDTKPGVLKGKFSYMAPEVVRGAPTTRQADVFSAAVVIWEMLAGRKLFAGASEQERLIAIVGGKYPSPRQFNSAVSPALERIVMKGLMPDPAARYASALEMAIDLEREVSLASQRVVGEWVSSRAADELDRRAMLLHDIETSAVIPAAAVHDRHSMFGVGHSVTAPSAVISALPPTEPRRRPFPLIVSAAALVAFGIIFAFRGGHRTTEVTLPSANPGAVASPPTSAPAPAPSAREAQAPAAPPPPTAPAPVESATTKASTPQPPRPTQTPKPAARPKSRGKHFLPSEL
ncbi:MAG TPA: serine/threonine-protein kinase, partial [Polyangiaceae bacterium]|nr:serine/threonine-protein kinase [Polyangiaceae bacterium]